MEESGSYGALFHLQLLNQFENTGPPPADRERIKSLPTISITEEHVGKSVYQSASQATQFLFWKRNEKDWLHACTCHYNQLI